jgi:dihydroxyacetone kinase-like protein
VVRADAPVKGKVGIATGGGSGHLPVFMGYVGKGFVDGCSIGNVFSSPTVEQMLTATQAINGGAGVLYLHGNYSGDVMNFGMAAEMADADGIGAVTPSYFGVNNREMEEYYVPVAKAVPGAFPVYLYNIPQLSANDLTSAVI